MLEESLSTRRTSELDDLANPRARRRSQRRALHAEVELRGASLATQGIVLNVSRGGLRVISTVPFALGEACSVRLIFGDRAARLEEARVVWSREERDGYILGIAYVD